MKFTTAILVGSLAAGAAAGHTERLERDVRHARHASFHSKRAPVPTEAEIDDLFKRDPSLAKRCGEIVPFGSFGSGPNCWGACASDPACKGGSSSSSGSSGNSNPAPAPAAPAASPAAPASSPASSPETNNQQAKGQNNKHTSAAASKPSSTPAPSSGGSSGSGSSSGGSSGGSKGGAKGVCYEYNGASALSGSWLSGSIAWAYNWASTSNGLNSKIQFVPMMHDLGSVGSFANDVAKVDSSTPLLSFNEPDMTQAVGGSLIDANTAAQKHKSVMGPLKQKGHPIVSPAVSSSEQNGQGLSWLSSFASACGSDCPIDACGIHWYGWNADASSQADKFKEYIGTAAAACKQHWPGKQIWVTEFAAQGPSGIKDVATNAAFLKIVVPWLDSNPDVARYSPFMVGDGDALGGSTPSTAGQALISG